jgi:hypothetical protein
VVAPALLGLLGRLHAEPQAGGVRARPLDAVPTNVVQAIKASPTGQVPYSTYKSSFRGG